MLIYMSSFNPPDFVVSIYNPTYFAVDTTGLTTADASALFLKKTSPDTATALETFTSGIATNTISPAVSATDMTISSSSATGAVIIDTGKTGSTNADPAVAIGTSNIAKTIKIGSGNANNSIHIGTLDIAGSNLNTTTGTTGVISIGNLQSTGTIDIGSLTTRTGAITIGSAGTSNVLPITIGSTAATATTTIRNPIMNLTYTTTPTYTSDQIGYRVIKLTNLTGTTSATANSVTEIRTFSVSPGVWMFEANLTFGTVCTFAWYISPTTAVIDTSRSCGGVYTTASVISRMSGIIVNSTTANWYLNASASVVSANISAIYLHITRIA